MPNSSVLSVIVVGGGIVGSSIAYRLADRGAAVTLVDKAAPASGCTGASFAWIGSSGDWPGAARDLRAAAVPQWRRLQEELPELSIRWCGSLWLGEGDQRSEIAALEPRITAPHSITARWPDDGFVDAAGAVEVLLRAAAQRGARVLTGVHVDALISAGGRVTGIATARGDLHADVVVLAAGAGTARLDGVDLPIEESPATLVRLDAPPGLVNSVVVTPDLEVHQAAGGLVAAVANGPDLLQSGQSVVQRLDALFGDSGLVRLRRVDVGGRPMPADRVPIIGRLAPGLYVTVMHSAVTLAPLVADLAAQELCENLELAALSGCRPDRFGQVSQP